MVSSVFCRKIRGGHAVSLLRNRHFWLVLGVVGVSIGFSMVSGREAATIWGQNDALRPKRRYVFIVVLNVTVWHRGWEKCVSKIDLLNRPGHAVSLLRNRHFWLVLGVVGVSIGFSMCLGVRLPRFEAKTTMLQATQTSFCLFHV